jgi:hypothetical protein
MRGFEIGEAERSCSFSPTSCDLPRQHDGVIGVARRSTHASVVILSLYVGIPKERVRNTHICTFAHLLSLLSFTACFDLARLTLPLSIIITPAPAVVTAIGYRACLDFGRRSCASRSVDIIVSKWK